MFQFINHYTAGCHVVMDSVKKFIGFTPGLDPTTPPPPTPAQLLPAAIFWSRGGRSRVESRGATPGFLARMYPTMTRIGQFEQKTG